jgi:hypothetical protein
MDQHPSRKAARAVACGRAVLAVACVVFPAHGATRCDECLIPSVMFYDFDASSLRPADTHVSNPAALDYVSLFMASGGCEDAAMHDARHECVEHYNAYYNPATHVGIVAAPLQALLPPAPPGGASYSDYYMGGSITGKQGGYLLSIMLKDSTTGALVTQTQLRFAKAVDALSAGSQAEAQLGTLFDAIRAYQKKLRDTSGDQTALHARFEVRPAQTKVKTGESTAVSIKLLDCDGTPLKHRSVTLRMESGPGTITPATVGTDGDGLAKATFTGGSTPGIAVFRPFYAYTSVTHRKTHAQGGETMIDVGQAPPRTWALRLHVTEDILTERHKATSTPQPYGQVSTTLNEVHGRETVDVRIAAWVAGPADSPDAFRNYSTDKIELRAGIGGRSKTLRTLDVMKDPGYVHTIMNSTTEEGDLKELSNVTLRIREGKITLDLEGSFVASGQTDYSETWSGTPTPIEPKQGHVSVELPADLLFNSDLAGVSSPFSPLMLTSRTLPIRIHLEQSQGDGESDSKVTGIWDIQGTFEKIN